MHYDIFNGDADGIFSLHQFRLENPCADSQLITGLKRDVHLLSQVEQVSNSNLIVFDLSLDSNRPSLLKILEKSNSVVYFDHHYAGTLIESDFLQTFIDPSPDVCTSLIVDKSIHGRQRLWAICGAFGDNLHHQAERLAQKLNLSEKQIGDVKELGELVNYNSYGLSLDDLHFPPANLYRAIQQYTNPFELLQDCQQINVLRQGYEDDISLAMQQPELLTSGKNRVFLLPDSRWARRVSGVFSNLRARERKGSAHAVITYNSDQTLRISVRAPLEAKRHADSLCKLFATGGGRASAAGINSLPIESLDKFLDTFQSFYP